MITMIIMMMIIDHDYDHHDQGDDDDDDDDHDDDNGDDDGYEIGCDVRSEVHLRCRWWVNTMRPSLYRVVRWKGATTCARGMKSMHDSYTLTIMIRILLKGNID